VTCPKFQIHKSGFTLIEFLVVLGLLVMTVGSTLLFLTSILKGSNKASVTAEAKQNGQLVLESLEKQIRSATFVEISPDKSRISLTLPDSVNKLHIICLPGSPTSNGKISVNEGAVVPDTPGSPFWDAITNTDSIAGVDVAGCGFELLGSSEGGVSPSVVSVKFTVNQGKLAPSRKDFVANVQLQTTISLRQYKQ